MDTTFLHCFGLALINAQRMLRDRGYQPEAHPVFFGEPTSPLDYATRAYAHAKASGCSLGESVTARFVSSAREPLVLWCFDRNYDVQKARDRMISTDQVKNMHGRIEADGSLSDGRGADCVTNRAAGPQNIVLSPSKLSPQAKKDPLNAELFLFDDLLIDLPRHELVVPHRVVSEAHVRAALGLAVNVKDLPVLLKTDAVARWYGWPVGTLVYVENPEVPTYRIVTDCT